MKRLKNRKWWQIYQTNCLFQAQPRTNDDSTTYDKIKHTLIDMGIPESEIAIKTADRDELKI